MEHREHVDVEARTLSILETQTALLSKIVDDTKESLREVYTRQMKEEIYAQFDKTAEAHREAVKLELIKQLTPEIKASLKAQYTVQAKVEVIKQLNEQLHSEFTRLTATLKSEVQSKLVEELSPKVKAMLRAELTEPVKKELRQELKAEVYTNRENDDCDENEGHQHSHLHQHSRDHDSDDSSLSPKRVNYDEEPSYHPSRLNDDKNLFFAHKQGDETVHVNMQQNAAPSSSATRGLKRPRFEQEDDEDAYWARGPKRLRNSINEWEKENRIGEGETGEETGEEMGDGTGEETGEQGIWGWDTRGSSKENAIELVDSDSDSEAIATMTAVPVSWSVPFLEDSDDEFGYTQARAYLQSCSVRAARAARVLEKTPTSSRRLNGSAPRRRVKRRV